MFNPLERIKAFVQEEHRRRAVRKLLESELYALEYEIGWHADWLINLRGIEYKYQAGYSGKLAEYRWMKTRIREIKSELSVF